MGVACGGRAGGVYCVEGGGGAGCPREAPREAVSRCGSAASKEIGIS